MILLRTSERTTYKRCRQKWEWSYVLGLQAKVSKPALRFGDLVHQALAPYYKPGRRRGPHPAKTFKKLYEEETKSHGSYGIRGGDEDTWQEAGALGVAMLENYIATYGKDNEIEVIYPEHTFTFKLRDAGGKVITYIGRFDALVRFVRTDEVGLMEHKTAASIQDEYLALDEQAGSYWAFARSYLQKKGILKPGHDLDMILYNFLRKATPDTRPQDAAGLYLNKDGSISKKQPAPYFQRVPVYRDEPDRRNVIRRIRLEAWEMRMAREGKLPIYKNPMKNCSWDCPFYHMCELHETGSDWKEFARQNYLTVDPYADYKQEMGVG